MPYYSMSGGGGGLSRSGYFSSFTPAPTPAPLHVGTSYGCVHVVETAVLDCTLV